MVVRMAAKRKQRIAIHTDGEFRVLDIGQIEIWDGADLALLRDSMTDVIYKGARHIGVEMRAVKYIPSGFFGMLFDWQDKGITMRLYRPQPNVRHMLWFRQFFEEICEGVFAMRKESLFDDGELGPSADEDEEVVADCELDEGFGDEASAKPAETADAESEDASSADTDDSAPRRKDRPTPWQTAHWLVLNKPQDKQIGSDSETSMAALRD